jgi:hypothetical protein
VAAEESVVVREDVDAILKALFDIRAMPTELVELNRDEDGDDADA